MINVENVNKIFPRYPKTVFDKGWVYGVWYCGTTFRSARLYGEYPPTFLRRALALFPSAKDILHCPSGSVMGPGITVDIQHTEVIRPQIIADAAHLPFMNHSFDLILSDPPYSDKDAENYGTGHFPLQKFMREALRILRPGGYLGMLHIFYPSYRRKEGWALVALICVVTGFSKKTRIFSIFQKSNQLQLAKWESQKAWVVQESPSVKVSDAD